MRGQMALFEERIRAAENGSEQIVVLRELVDWAAVETRERTRRRHDVLPALTIGPVPVSQARTSAGATQEGRRPVRAKITLWGFQDGTDGSLYSFEFEALGVAGTAIDEGWLVDSAERWRLDGLGPRGASE